MRENRTSGTVAGAPGNRSPYAGENTPTKASASGSSMALPSGIIVYTVMPMNISFDPVKDRLNIANHGVSLAVAADLEWNGMGLDLGERRRPRSLRRTTLDRLRAHRPADLLRGFTEEQDCYRIISLREATNREKRTYIDHL